MIGALVGLLLLSWLFGRTRRLLGGLGGGFIGALVLTGMARTARNGELAALFTPGELASAALVIPAVAALLALIAPYATGIASPGWSAGPVRRPCSAGARPGGVPPAAGPPRRRYCCRPVRGEVARGSFVAADQQTKEPPILYR